MFSDFLTQATVAQRLASQHAPLQFMRGFVRDCGSQSRLGFSFLVQLLLQKFAIIFEMLKNKLEICFLGVQLIS